jgi:hypothetical protein
MKKLVLVLLAGMCFAQTKPVKESHPTDGPGKVDTNPIVVPIPDIPVGYQDQFKTLVIKQKDIQLDEMQLQARYQADIKAADQANAEGLALETKVLAQFKLDPAKYTTVYKDGKIVIVAKEEKK